MRAHAFTLKLRCGFWYCQGCGLVLLNNRVTQRERSKTCKPKD